MKRSENKGYNRTIYRLSRWFRRQKWGKILLVLLLIAAWPGIMYVFMSPSLWEFRSSKLFGSLLWGCIILSVGLYVWIGKRHSPLLERVMATVPILWPWGTLLIPSVQARILVWSVVLYGMIAYCLYLAYLYQTEYESELLKTIVIETVLLGMLYALAALQYSLATESLPLVLWLPALIVALVGVAVSIFVIRRLFPWEDRWWAKAGWALLTAGLTFIITMFSVMHFNYVFDLAEPEAYTACVKEKDYSSSTRGGTSFYLILDVNGQRIKMDVSESDYCSHEIGDDFAVELHQGAFGVPYYIAGE